MLVAVGGYIFYNTNVLNEYRTQLDDEERAAELREGAARVRGGAPAAHRRCRAERRDLSASAARRDHRAIHDREPRAGCASRDPRPVGPRHRRFSGWRCRGARLRQEFEGFNYRIYDLEPPLEAGARAEMRFATVREQRGFRNARNQVDIVGNGTFLNNMLIAPFLGMGREELLQDRAKRRKYGLPPEHAPAQAGRRSRPRQPLSPARHAIGRPPTSPSRPTPISRRSPRGSRCRKPSRMAAASCAIERARRSCTSSRFSRPPTR